MTRTLSRFSAPRLEHSQVLELLEQERRSHPTWADVLNRHGLLLMTRGAWDEALIEFEDALDINPDYAWARMNRAACLWMQGNRPEAWAALDPEPQGVGKARDITAAWFHLLEGDTTQASYIIQRLPSETHRRPDVLWIKTALAETTGSETAPRLWHQLISDGVLAESPHAVTRMKSDAGSGAEWGLFPGLFDLYKQASTMAAHLGERDLAETLALNQYIVWSDRSEYWNQMALVATLCEDEEAAVEYYTRSMKTVSNDPTAPAALAEYWAGEGDFDRARHYMQTAVERAPGHADLHRSMGRIESARGSWAGALEACRKALNINPDYVTARLEEAYYLYHLGIWNEAALAFQRVVEKGLGSQDVFLHLARCYEHLGQGDRAQEFYRRQAG